MNGERKTEWIYAGEIDKWYINEKRKRERARKSETIVLMGSDIVKDIFMFIHAWPLSDWSPMKLEIINVTKIYD